ncbi:MAG TPA: hypothetical protein VIW29_07005 [Polyangiaceae bacterium]
MKRAAWSLPRRAALLVTLAGVALGLLASARPAPAAPPRAFVVLLEHGSGTPGRAQPFLDELLLVVAKQNQWPKPLGRYFSERAPALDFVQKEQPSFGILSLGAFLALKGSWSLSVVGEVVAPKAGGRQYFLVSKRAAALAACKGQPLTTTFASDAKLVDQVVAGGAFRLADFKLVEARRPLEPLKQVLRGEAACALIDDAQLEATHHIEQGQELKPIWRSAELPGMPVVAFPRADAASVQTFKQSLGELCTKAKQACTNVGIEVMRPSDAARYRAVLDAYSKSPP